MALLSAQPRYGRLEVGKHIVKIADVKDVENEKGGYVQVVFKKENGQEETGTYFPAQVKGLIGQLRDALGLPVEEAFTDYDVLDLAMENEFEIEILYRAAVNSDTGEIKKYRNIQISNDPVEATETEPVKTAKANAKKTVKTTKKAEETVINKELGF